MKSAHWYRNHGHLALQVWANNMQLPDEENTTGLGYPNSTMEGRLQKEGVIIRTTQRNRMLNILFLSYAVATTVRLVSFWYKGVPSEWKKVIDYKYLRNGSEGQKQAAYTRRTGKSRTTYYRRWDDAREDIGRKAGKG